MPASGGGYRKSRIGGGYPGSGPCELMALGLPVYNFTDDVPSLS